MNRISNKWVWKLNRDLNNQIEQYKARHVACGITQTKGVDFGTSFAPVLHLNSFCTILALALQNNIELKQSDVKSAFLCNVMDVKCTFNSQRDSRLMIEFVFYEKICMAYVNRRDNFTNWLLLLFFRMDYNKHGLILVCSSNQRGVKFILLDFCLRHTAWYKLRRVWRFTFEHLERNGWTLLLNNTISIFIKLHLIYNRWFLDRKGLSYSNIRIYRKALVLAILWKLII